MKTLENEADRQEILRRLAALGPDSLRQWGKMSCHQAICHLSDALRCPLGEKVPRRAFVPMPRGLYRWMALNMPVEWPKGVKTRPEMEQGAGGTAPLEFSADRETLLRLMDRFTSAPADYSWAEHPMFGHMSRKDWMRWAYLHNDHHLRQFGA